MDLGPYFLLATLEGLLMAAVLALTALGLSLVFGVMRVVNVAHGEFYMLGAVSAWWVASLVAQAGISSPAIAFAAALLVAPPIAGVVALAAERLILRRLDYRPEPTIVATIGLLYMIQQGVLTLFGPDARPVRAPFDLRLDLYWFGWSGYKLAVIVFAIVLIVVARWVLVNTRAGLIMRATEIDTEMARALGGIDTRRVYAGVFTLGAMLAALAAVLIVPIQQAHYLMGLDPLLLSFVVVIVGGLGSLRGTLVAALLIGLSDGIVSVFFAPTLAKILATLLVALVLVFRPQGLYGEAPR